MPSTPPQSWNPRGAAATRRCSFSPEFLRARGDYDSFGAHGGEVAVPCTVAFARRESLEGATALHRKGTQGRAGRAPLLNPAVLTMSRQGAVALVPRATLRAAPR